MKSTGKKVYMAEVRGGMGITLHFLFLRNPSMRDVETAVNDLLASDDEYPKKQLDTQNWEDDFTHQYGQYYDVPFDHSVDHYEMFEIGNMMIQIQPERIIDNSPQL